MTSRLEPVARRAVPFPAVACFVGFLLLGHGVGEFYPFSPLGMFREKLPSASRLLVRRAGGAIAEISAFTDWACEGPIEFREVSRRECPATGFSAYDDNARDYMLAHPGPPGDASEQVEIVRRIFTIPTPGGTIQSTDCRLFTCAARHRPRPAWTPRI